MPYKGWLLLISGILLFMWLLGVLYYAVTGLIHLLAVLAVIVLLLAIIRRA